ncbi:MAG: DegT/DnrJ/EryC1/StrS family aminotransferase [Bacteroidales bacterium]|jgi:dTDP-4-amino-4,6-dideoxygalactose transaminase|nr:DegT/DnrJ/EryC1/StrS family aminotransferase [Bacteroidales bacterium]
MDYKILLFDLNFDQAEQDAVIETLRSKWISTGPKNAELERRFAEMTGARHAVALTNCTVALHMALVLNDIRPGDEVICPSLTFVATVNAIRYVNAIPVFADVKSMEDLTIDPDDIEKKITPRTKAIMLMHYGGFACNMNRIMTLADKHNLLVIEDACHGPLSEYEGKKLGTIGSTGCFSFFSNKNISTGEGGMIITNDDNIYEKAKLLRSHGMTSLSFDRAKGHSTEYDVIELGYNYRMDDIRASIGIVQLDKLPGDLAIRAELRARYEKNLDRVEEIVIPFKGYKYFTSNYIFPIVLKNSTVERRNRVREHLAEAGIQTSVHYPAVHRFAIYREYASPLPNTEYAADNIVTLPMFSKLTHEQVDYICDTLKEAAAKK